MSSRNHRVDDSYDLQRFVDAQAPFYKDVLLELREGQKRGHWMWFIFPQIKGLGYSYMANKFGISARGEAETYLRHPILGPRLRECSRLVTLVEGRSIEQIFGYPDYLKFRSSMTLFAQATPESDIFKDAVTKYFGGEFDHLTLDRLRP